MWVRGVIVGLAVAGVCGAVAVRRGWSHEWLRLTVERIANQRLAAQFHGTIRLGDAHLEPGWRLVVRDVRATLTRGEISTPLAVDMLACYEPVAHFVTGQPMAIRFDGLRPAAAARRGLHGLVHLTRKPHTRCEIVAVVDELNLEDLEWAAPAYFAGSTGALEGWLSLRGGQGEEPYLALRLQVREPGGLLPGRALQVLTPYLPSAPTVRALASSNRLVGFRDARMELHPPQNNRLTAFLHLNIPEYNVNVNLTVELRVDAENIVTELLKLWGLFRA